MFSATSIFVTGASVDAGRDVRRTTRGGVTRLRVPAWSGQRSPTGAGVMHSVQIGRPHSEHESPSRGPGAGSTSAGACPRSTSRLA